jgi:hypothetical protein
MQPVKVGDIIIVYPNKEANANGDGIAFSNGAQKIPAIVTQTFDSYQNGECNCRAFTDGPGDSAPLWFTSIPHKSCVGEGKLYPEGITYWDFI